MGTRVLIRGLSCDAHGAGSPMWPAVEVSDAHFHRWNWELSLFVFISPPGFVLSEGDACYWNGWRVFNIYMSAFV